MARKKAETPADNSAEERIKEAARRVFLKKGLAASRTRDIAEEAGLNIALLHYYFRSKDNLFGIVMMETLQQFAHGVIDMLNDDATSLQEKLAALSGRYIDLLTEQPELPMFILTEIHSNPGKLISRLGIREVLMRSVFMKQFLELSAAKGAQISPLQLFLSFLGMTVFPFIGKPVVQEIWGMDNEEYNKLMQERKKLIPMWIKKLTDPS